jgi:hypothetical protein
LRAAFAPRDLRGVLPPVVFRAVCFVRAIDQNEAVPKRRNQNGPDRNDHLIETLCLSAMIVHGQEGTVNADGLCHQKWPVFASFVSGNIRFDDFGIAQNLTMLSITRFRNLRRYFGDRS